MNQNKNFLYSANGDDAISATMEALNVSSYSNNRNVWS